MYQQNVYNRLFFYLFLKTRNVTRFFPMPGTTETFVYKAPVLKKNIKKAQ